mgnify:CR=1 FL=1
MNAQTRKRRKRIAKWRGAYSYRIPMQIRLYIQHWWRDVYPLCPRCDNSLERDLLGYCYHCGQKLGWDRLNEVCFIKAGDNERKFHGKRRVWLTATRDEDIERLCITVPCTEGRNRRSISGRDREGAKNAQPEQLHQDRGGVGRVGGLSVAK